MGDSIANLVRRVRDNAGVDVQPVSPKSMEDLKKTLDDAVQVATYGGVLAKLNQSGVAPREREEGVGQGGGDIAATIVTKAFTSLQEMQTAEGSARREAEKARDEAQKSYWTKVADDLHEQRKRVEEAPNPYQQMSAFTSVFKDVMGIFNDMKKDWQPERGQQMPGMDGSTLIQIKSLELEASRHHDSILLEIERMRDERQERQLRFERELTAEHRTFDFNVKKWEDEKQLKMAELSDKQAMQRNAFGHLTSLTGSLAGAIEMERATEGAALTQPKAEQAPGLPQDTGLPYEFNCESCGQKLNAVEYGVVTCPQCGGQYQVSAGSQ